MKISRSNYEIWFTDSADNNLTKAQIEELNIFLQLNPDLKEEYEEFMDAMNSDRHSCFRGKERLTKSPEELPEDQFEMLSVAFHENDLTGKQREEVLEMVAADAEKKKIFDTIGRIRLRAPATPYGRKEALLRKTPISAVLRVTWIALGAAASVAAIMLVSSLLRFEKPSDLPLAAASRDSILINAPQKLTAPRNEAGKEPAFNHNRNIIASVEKQEMQSISVSERNTPEQADIPGKISFTGAVFIAGIASPQKYLAGSTASFSPVAVDDGRSRISKFIARTFREKILNEKEVSDTRLKGYELAEAGIDGLNKLLGWEMALTTKSDENGDVNSVSFKSKIIRFSAPVKKNENAE